MATLRRTAAAILLALTTTVPAAAEPWPRRDAAKVLFFGNSLIHHLTDSDATTVPHWLALMARHAGKSFASDGLWGFPRDFSGGLPPQANWTFAQVPAVRGTGQALDAADYDVVILNTENFVQARSTRRRYGGDNPGRESPLTATLAVAEWVGKGNPDAAFWIYEGWADMNPHARSFPPDPAELARYYRHARGRYHDWYGDLVARLQRQRPGQDIRLIPVGRVLAELLTSPELAPVPVEALYSDISPHGTATIYLLAAMVTYAAVYGERPPAGLAVAGDVVPEVAQGYEAIADRIWAAMSEDAG